MGGYLHHFAAQGADKGAVFSLCVYNDDIIICSQRHVGDGGFHRHRLAGAGHAQVKAVGRDQALAVTDKQIFTDCVHTIIHPARVLYLLGPERHKDCGALGCESAQSLYPAQAVRQDSVQAVLLLIAQDGELAKVLPANGKEGFGVRVKLLQGVGDMGQGDNREHHPLVTDSQIVQKLFCFGPKLLQLIRNAGRKIVLGVLPLLPAGYIRFHAQNPLLDFFYSLVRGDRENVNGNHQIAGKIGEVGNHFIFDVAGVLFEKKHPAKLAAHLKMPSLKL